MIWYGFANSNTTLVVFPLLAFLTRYSLVFTPIRTIVLSLIIFLAPLLTTIGYGYTETNLRLALHLAYASNISIMVGTALFGTLMIIATVSVLIKSNKTDDKKPDENKLANDRFRAVVIGVHMLCTLVTLLVQSIWFWYAGVSSLSSNQLVMILFSSIGAAALVYVVEFRVRKNEFMQVGDDRLPPPPLLLLLKQPPLPTDHHPPLLLLLLLLLLPPPSPALFFSSHST